jgi:hypothetical protein
MALASADELPAPAPPQYSTLFTSDIHAAAVEVYQRSQNLTAEQRTVADFWSDNPGQTGTPPGHWMALVSQIARDGGLSLAQTAEAYARVGIAVHEAFICCWRIKYATDLLRPVTYIRDPTCPINDAVWSSPIGTPPFPEYTSGHSTQSGAASYLLSDLLGAIPFTDESHAGIPLPARSFDSFEEAAQEAAISRLYGGIHYRSAIEHGVDQGRCIGRTVRDNVVFREE